MAGSETAKLIAELGFKDKLTPGVNKALGSVSKLDKGLGRAGKGVGQLGVGMARAGVLIGTAAVAGLGAAAKAAIDWEDAFAGVVKTVDETDLTKAGLTFRDLELSLRKMSTTMPIAASDLAAIAEAGGAMGIAGKDIEEFTRVVALIGSTTNVAVEEAATSLGQLTNVLGLTADEYDNFAAALVDLGNKGSSTEAQILEIAKRSGGAAKQIGIAKDETLGWSAAAANLGLNEELAGTAVQRFFLLTQTAISESGSELKLLAKISGQSTKQFKKNFDKDASGALEDFLGGLGKMSKDARLKAVQDIFGKGTGLTRLILGLSDSIDTNLTPSLDTSTEAWAANTAAQVEFDKRNATVRSGITRLKNSVIDAAITVGEGFAPALGKAAGKLSEFLAQDVNRNALKAIGEDIGKAIDAIDWKQVLDGARTFVTVMKSALSFAKLLLDAVMALPTEVKAAGLGLIGLNKLSGGLVGAGIGNIVGGVGESAVRGLGSKIPGVGRLFAQPVFVTNWPPGGLPGGGPDKGIGDKLGWLTKLIGAIGVTVAVEEAVRAGIEYGAKNTELGDKGLNAAEIAAVKYYQSSIAEQQTAAKRLGYIPTKADFDAAMEKLGRTVTTPPKPTPGKPVPMNPRSADPAYREWKSNKDTGVVTAVEKLKSEIGPSLSKTPVKLDAVKTASVEAGIKAKNAGDATKTAIDNTKTAVTTAGLLATLATTTAGIGTQNTVRNVAPPIVSAIRAIPAPQTFVSVNVSATHVTKSTTIQNRYGPGNGSSGQNQRSGELEY